MAAIDIEFSYEGDNGPLHWSEMFPGAKGLNQSPINIETSKTEYRGYLKDNPIQIHYEEGIKIRNTGYSFQVFFDHETESYASGGPVKDRHKFLQMHMHWGADNGKGSEHSIDGKYYAAELHFVNWNNSQYATAQEAMASENHDGLLVLGAFAQLGRENAELGKIIAHFHNIHMKGQVDDVPETILWEKLFPRDLDSYYTYRGSLTTPPCTECVRWVLFKNCIELSHRQLEQLRSLSTSPVRESKMMCNDRPACDLHHRKVYKSFDNE